MLCSSLMLEISGPFFTSCSHMKKNVHMLIRYEFLWRKEILGLKFFTFLGPKYKNKKVTPLTLIHTHIGWGWLIHEDWTISRFRFLFDENRLLLHFFCLVGVRVRWLRGWGESQRSGSSSMMREEWMVKKNCLIFSFWIYKWARTKSQVLLGSLVLCLHIEILNSVQVLSRRFSQNSILDISYFCVLKKFLHSFVRRFFSSRSFLFISSVGYTHNFLLRACSLNRSPLHFSSTSSDRSFIFPTTCNIVDDIQFYNQNRTEPSRESKVSFSAALCPQAEQGDRYIRAEFKNSKSAHEKDVIMYKRRTGELWKFFFEHKKWEKKIILKLCWFKCYQFYYGVSTG